MHSRAAAPSLEASAPLWPPGRCRLNPPQPAQTSPAGRGRWRVSSAPDAHARKTRTHTVPRVQVLAQANAFRHLPPHKLDAKLPEQAYPVAQLLPSEVAVSLRPGLLLKAAQEPATLDSLRGKHTVR